MKSIAKVLFIHAENKHELLLYSRSIYHAHHGTNAVTTDITVDFPSYSLIS